MDCHWLCSLVCSQKRPQTGGLASSHRTLHIAHRHLHLYSPPPRLSTPSWQRGHNLHQVKVLKVPHALLIFGVPCHNLSDQHVPLNSCFSFQESALLLLEDMPLLVRPPQSVDVSAAPRLRSPREPCHVSHPETWLLLMPTAQATSLVGEDPPPPSANISQRSAGIQPDPGALCYSVSCGGHT